MRCELEYWFTKYEREESADPIQYKYDPKAIKVPRTGWFE